MSVFICTKILGLGRIEGADGMPNYYEHCNKIQSSFIGCQDSNL